ncbi:hypothetical protein A2863_04520 [Candidatus Woesebacteria bacterium RIFCSPHIGHO2_01_FULL_38_9b]|uniref:CBS domain-containing protein n=1 Tax=Candidatus Woesebacteria bacterium RIFCSPHIGHO2_01_FULL_38_9b TaxID=1802493 RepID=A0A1F7Y0A8_9BACT|nr:MAG: hypothetical protein A2863_04520 [Candidatus Woesebacteria bacterium RIFCSPHIGHO2_01_FULL_38_9b]
MFVRDLMAKNVVTVSSTESFSEIVKLLVRKKITGVPVISKKGKVVGIISEKDLFYRLFPSQEEFYKDLEYFTHFNNIEKDAKRVIKLKAKNIMSKKVISVCSDDHIMRACSLFVIHNIRRLPVIDDGKLVGIVTTNNIYKNFLNTLVKNNKK